LLVLKNYRGPGRSRPISEIDGRAAQDVSVLVENDAEAATPVEERQSIPPRILIDAALADTGDFVGAHAIVHKRGIEAQPLPDHGGVNLHASSCEFDSYHHIEMATKGPSNKAPSIMAAIAKSRHTRIA
jgi:hypothetical protein